MMVKLYFNPELCDVTLDEESAKEYESIMKELDIERTHTTSEVPMPYPIANKAMMNVITTLCPVDIVYKKYNRTAIPLEVLKAIKYCVENKFFNDIAIYYNEEDADPFAIGIMCKYYNNSKDENGNYKYFDTKEECLSQDENEGKAYMSMSHTKHYLIAKWGDEDKTFEELTKMASEKLVGNINAELKAKQAEIEGKLKVVKENVSLFLSGKIDAYSLKN